MMTDFLGDENAPLFLLPGSITYSEDVSLEISVDFLAKQFDPDSPANNRISLDTVIRLGDAIFARKRPDKRSFNPQTGEFTHTYKVSVDEQPFVVFIIGKSTPNPYFLDAYKETPKS
jgi:hypothetical protein